MRKLSKTGVAERNGFIISKYMALLDYSKIVVKYQISNSRLTISSAGYELNNGNDGQIPETEIMALIAGDHVGGGKYDCQLRKIDFNHALLMITGSMINLAKNPTRMDEEDEADGFVVINDEGGIYIEHISYCVLQDTYRMPVSGDENRDIFKTANGEENSICFFVNKGEVTGFDGHVLSEIEENEIKKIITKLLLAESEKDQFVMKMDKGFIDVGSETSVIELSVDVGKELEEVRSLEIGPLSPNDDINEFNLEFTNEFNRSTESVSTDIRAAEIKATPKLH
jgi:hypothetical protein